MTSLGYGKKQVFNCQRTKIGPFLHEIGHLLGRIHEHSHPDRKAVPLLDRITNPNIKQYTKLTDLQGVK
jgi:metal-dependent HD superfamily phosphatase/phosphodiesterase